MGERVKPIRAVLFDFDGTLTLPGHLDFPAIRAGIGCPPGASLLGYIDSLKDAAERHRASEILERFEAAAADRSREDPDAAAVVRVCRQRNLRMGIITRNSRASVERSFAHFSGITLADFSCIVTRDDPIGVKPAPDGVLFACERLGASADEAMVVGDYLYDIEAGERAGAVTVFYDSAPNRPFEPPRCDHHIERLGELPFILSLYEPLPEGKVPNEMIAHFLSASSMPPAAGTDELLVGPGVGEDVAAIAPEDKDRVLLLKSDPITLAGERVGHYLLTVNANDIATAGGTPRWLLATLLLPPGTLGAEIGRLFDELRSECERAGVVLCGGHSELTAAVTRPIVSGTMIGTVQPGSLVRKDGMRSGDRIVVTKGVAIEGTAILATEHRELLRARGVPAEVIRAAARLSEQMSIAAEARTAIAHGCVTAMHDVTEGGIATALRELSVAGRHCLRIDLESIPVLPETRQCCEALDLDPLGLIGSGSLLMCIRAGSESALVSELSGAGIAAAVIGEVLGAGEGIDAHRRGLSVELPSFAVDELTRL